MVEGGQEVEVDERKWRGDESVRRGEVTASTLLPSMHDTEAGKAQSCSMAQVLCSCCLV